MEENVDVSYGLGQAYYWQKLLVKCQLAESSAVETHSSLARPVSDTDRLLEVEQEHPVTKGPPKTSVEVRTSDSLITQPGLETAQDSNADNCSFAKSVLEGGFRADVPDMALLDFGYEFDESRLENQKNWTTHTEESVDFGTHKGEVDSEINDGLHSLLKSDALVQHDHVAKCIKEVSYHHVTNAESNDITSNHERDTYRPTDMGVVNTIFDIQLCKALTDNYSLLKWSKTCTDGETAFYQHREAVTIPVPRTEEPAMTSDISGIYQGNSDILSNIDKEERLVAAALEMEYMMTKMIIKNKPGDIQMGLNETLTGNSEDFSCNNTSVEGEEGNQNLSEYQRVKTSDDDSGVLGNATLTALSGDGSGVVGNATLTALSDDGSGALGNSTLTALSDDANWLRHLNDDASSTGSRGFYLDSGTDDWESWSSASSVESTKVQLPPSEGEVHSTENRGIQTDNRLCTDRETQTENRAPVNSEAQTENRTENEEVQTEGEIAQCCQCNVYTFLPLGEQFVIRLKEEMSQRLSLENLIRIVERDAWNVRQELMDEREGVIRIQAEAADLKGKVTHADHVSAELKTRNDELETSLEGARNMINRLEQQISNTTYFNSGIDYMLEAKLSQGRAVEALAKVTVLQNELLHSQSEVGKLLEQISTLTKEKNEMVSNSVHEELLQIADNKVRDAELRTLQLENEVFALREENKQLKSVSSSVERPSALMSSTTPYKFMFNEQADPYKEIMALKEDMIHLKAKSLGYSPFAPLESSYTSMYTVGGASQANLLPADPILPDLGSFTTSDPSPLQVTTTVSLGCFPEAPLVATGSDSEESDWSDEDEHVMTSADVIKTADVPELIASTTGSRPDRDLYSLPMVPIGDRLKPAVPPKPRRPPKPQTSLGTKQDIGLFDITAEPEQGTSFEEFPVQPQLSPIRKPRGPAGRQRPGKYS